MGPFPNFSKLDSTEDVPHVAVDDFRIRVNHLAGGVLDRLAEVSVSEYPNDTPHHVVRLIKKIIKQIKRYAGVTTNIDALAMMCDLLQLYGQLLRFLDNANTQQTPRALTEMLEWLYERLGVSTSLLACPKADYNYAIFDLLKWLKTTSGTLLYKNDVDEIFSTLDPIKLITFPRIERDNVLVHAIFGHEIGHPFADEYLDYEDPKGPDDTDDTADTPYKQQFKRIRDKADEEIARKLNPDADFAGRLQAQSQIVEEIITIRRRGLQELLSDAVSVQIFGPSAIFAAQEIFMTANLDVIPKSDSWYPPNRYRLRRMMQIADQKGMLTALQKAAPGISTRIDELENIAANQSDRIQLQKNPYIKLAYEWIEEVLDSATIYVLKQTKSVAYSPTNIRAEVPELLKRLALNIPPNERGDVTRAKPVDWRSSVLSAWVYRFENQGKKCFKIKGLFDITKKAIEHVLLRESFMHETEGKNGNPR